MVSKMKEDWPKYACCVIAMLIGLLKSVKNGEEIYFMISVTILSGVLFLIIYNMLDILSNIINWAYKKLVNNKK